MKWLDAAEVGVAEYGGEETGMGGHGGEEVAEAGVLGGIDEDEGSEGAGRCTVAVHGVELEAEAGVYTGCKSVDEEGVGSCSMADTGEVDDRVQDPAEGNCVTAVV